MEPVLPEFTGFLSRLTLHEPQIPLLSNLTGTWLAPGEATNPATWARQIRATVRFSDELDALLANPGRVFVEVGPGGTLTSSAMRHPKWSEGHRAVRLMRHHAQNRSDRDTFLLALGQLWSAGIDVDWTPLRGDRQPQLVSLPGYPFERQRHWVEHNSAARWVEGAPETNGTAASPSGGHANPTQAVTNGSSPMEATLQRIFAMCLGVGSVDRNANFFDLGGDSLVAISVAMAASHEGLDLTPQDLYDNPTLAGLAKALQIRYAAGGLARQSPGDVVHPPVPPNIMHFLENGVRERGQWRDSGDPATSPRCVGRGHPFGAHRRDQPPRRVAPADRTARRNMGTARRRTAGIRRVGYPVASRRRFRPEARRSVKRCSAS